MPETDSASSSLAAALERSIARLVAQCQAYEAVLPASNFEGRAAVRALKELALVASTEARDLEQNLRRAIEPPSETPLTAREHELLVLVAAGHANKEIAYRLRISEKTVQFHIRSIFDKTGASSRTEAVTLGIRAGWLSLG